MLIMTEDGGLHDKQFGSCHRWRFCGLGEPFLYHKVITITIKTPNFLLRQVQTGT